MEEALVTVLNSLRAVEALFGDALGGTPSKGDPVENVLERFGKLDTKTLMIVFVLI